MAQPACLEKKKSYLLEIIQLANQIAGLRTQHSLHCNLPLASKNELAGRVPTKDSDTLTSIITLGIFKAQTPILAASALAPIISFTNKLYQQLIKPYAAIMKLLEQN